MTELESARNQGFKSPQPHHLGLFNNEGKLNRFIHICVDDGDMRFLNGLETKLSMNDKIPMLPAVSGG